MAPQAFDEEEKLRVVEAIITLAKQQYRSGNPFLGEQDWLVLRAVAEDIRARVPGERGATLGALEDKVRMVMATKLSNGKYDSLALRELGLELVRRWPATRGGLIDAELARARAGEEEG